MSTNYRSAECIVDIGNALMAGHGAPARPQPNPPAGSIWVADARKFESSIRERETWPGDAITPMATRLAAQLLSDDAKANVVFLARRNAWSDGRALDQFLRTLRSAFPDARQRRIGISTVHKYKGLEQATVIILDASARSYPLLHPDWVFNRILGETEAKIIDEERRLFYVAITRAKQNLIIISDGKNPSPFLEGIEARESIERVDWEQFPEVPSSDGRIVVKVANAQGRGSQPTLAIKELLKAQGFRWDGGAKCWARIDAPYIFDLEQLKNEVWAKEADGIVIQIDDGSVDGSKSYVVEEGCWKPVV